MKYNGQLGQDLFVLCCLDFKKNGYFLEIGASDYKKISNTYLLETEYKWKGIMIEYDSRFFKEYSKFRTNSYPILSDATEVNYKEELQKYNFPNQIDYLQIDLEPTLGTPIQTLELLDSTILDFYTFSVITFEHDIYSGDHFNTRARSREILNKRGYVLVFADVCNDGNPLEDWWVHPSGVSKEKIQSFQTTESLEYTSIVKRLTNKA
jgi:hypothetical protein